MRGGGRRGGESREGDVLGDMWKNESICDHFSTYTDRKFSKTISLKVSKMFIQGKKRSINSIDSCVENMREFHFTVSESFRNL